MHYRLLYPSEYLNAADLMGKDVKCVIESVSVQPVPGRDGKKKDKPIVRFRGKTKAFPLPKTCARVIAGAYGKDTEAWVGKTVTLFATTCDAFGEKDVECIRVRID